MVSDWKRAWQDALKDPVEIEIPYREKSLFFPNEADAAGFKFAVRRGEIINIQIIAGFNVFAELFSAAAANAKAVEVLAENQSALEFEADENGAYILVIQPELLSGGSCEIVISSGPSVAFPVTGRKATDIGSFWGAGRDAGKRAHEGVDIFAPRGTPVTAVVGGMARSGNNNLGGKVVWLSQPTKGRSFYYAHLDSQLVHGAIVKRGDTLGLVGNTGNAKYTPPHLHFGIYYFGAGAVDPFPFINDVRAEAKSVTADTSLIGKYAVIAPSAANVRNLPSTKSAVDTLLHRNNVFRIKAATSDWYRAEFPDGKTGYLHSSVVAAPGNSDDKIPPGTYSVRIALLKTALVSDSITIDTDLPILGTYAGDYLVEYDLGKYLWVKH